MKTTTIVRRFAALALLLGLCLVATIGCGAPLKPCPTGTVRAWCLMEVRTNSLANFNSGCDPVVTQTAVTSCVAKVGRTSAGNVIAIILKVTTWLQKNYQSQGGFLDYVIKGNQVISAGFATDAAGDTLCTAQNEQTNPFGTPYVNLDASSIEPKIHPETAAGGGGSADTDCEACLAEAGCTMEDLGTCAHDHCAALCPDTDSGGACSSTTGLHGGCAGDGEPCGPAVCCAPLSCYAGPGSSVCM